MKKLICLCFIFSVMIISCNQKKEILFSDEFSELTRGPFGSNTGAHTEYHYLHQAKPKGNWAISTHKTSLPSPWSVRDINGKRVLLHNEINKNNHWHPMVVAGDALWENYTVKASFSSMEKGKQCGILFRYNNSRCYYFIGVKQDTAILKMVKHATAYHKPHEIILGSQAFNYKANKEIKVSIDVNGDKISASFENGPSFSAVDTTFYKGKIGFMADGPAYLSSVEVTCSRSDKMVYENLRQEVTATEQDLTDNNPKPVLWKKSLSMVSEWAGICVLEI